MLKRNVFGQLKWLGSNLLDFLVVRIFEPFLWFLFVALRLDCVIIVIVIIFLGIIIVVDISFIMLV